METLELKNINMLTKEQFDSVTEPAMDELYAVSSSGFGKPSSKYIDLTLGASGSSYTAPADGWVCLEKKTTGSNQWLQLNTDRIIDLSNAPASGNSLTALISVSKGEPFWAYYSAAGDTLRFKFFFDEGEI